MEFSSLGLKNQMGSVDLKFLPSQVDGLVLWPRFNQGITVIDSGVSQWDDQSGEGNHFKQAVDANRMTKEADGSVLGNGVDQFLQTDAITLNQPTEIFILVNPITWTSTDRIFDGRTNNGGTLQQSGTTPQLRMLSVSTALGNISPVLNIYSVIMTVFNSTSSILQLNNDSPVTGDAGAGSMGGFTLGANGSLSQFGNAQVKELAVYDATLDAASRLQIINYLARVGGLSI